MLRFSQCLAVPLICSLFSAVLADTVENTNGGDQFVAGSGISQDFEADRDVFVGGSSVTLKGAVAGDAHAAGFDIDVESRTAGNLYVAGASATVRADVGADLTMLGASLRTSQTARTGGNARLIGRTLTIDGPIDGALTALGWEVILNAPVSGDVWIVAEKITYGPKATIAGNLRYASSREIAPPERVIASERVTYEKTTRSDRVKAVKKTWEGMEYPMLPTMMSMLAGFLISLVFIIVLGAGFLTFLPKPVERLRASIETRPGMSFLVGVMGLSMLFGMVPITALTIFGLPLLPIVILTIVTAWTLGYVLAAYAVGMRVWSAFGGAVNPSLTGRLVALAVAVILIGILHFVPFLGWVANYTLVLLGIGAITSMIFEKLMGNPGEAMDVDMRPIRD